MGKSILQQPLVITGVEPIYLPNRKVRKLNHIRKRQCCPLHTSAFWAKSSYILSPRLVNGPHLRCAIAPQFPKSMITDSVTGSCIPKPELFNWKICLVSQETAVFTPYTVIFITVTAKTGACTWVGHPACALTTAWWRSTPVRHLCGITGHPPSTFPAEYHWIITLVLNKLLTLWRDSGKTCQLRQTRSCVMNVTRVTPFWITSRHMYSCLLYTSDAADE